MTYIGGNLRKKMLDLHRKGAHPFLFLRVVAALYTIMFVLRSDKSRVVFLIPITFKQSGRN